MNISELGVRETQKVPPIENTICNTIYYDSAPRMIFNVTEVPLLEKACEPLLYRIVFFSIDLSMDMNKVVSYLMVAVLITLAILAGLLFKLIHLYRRQKVRKTNSKSNFQNYRLFF